LIEFEQKPDSHTSNVVILKVELRVEQIQESPLDLIGLFTKIERVQIICRVSRLTSGWSIRHVHNEEKIDDFDAVGEAVEFGLDLANLTQDMFDLLAVVAFAQVEIARYSVSTVVVEQVAAEYETE
jgi:hypothetical protein